MGKPDPPGLPEGTRHIGELPRLDDSIGPDRDDKTPIVPAKPVLDLAGFGRYTDLQPIGSGGAGQVFRAFDAQLNRFVALKFLWIESPEHAERFKEEARAQARLEHDSVCKVYEVGEVSGRLFLAMQYVHGRTLREAARQLALADRVRAMKSVAEALHAAHRLGVIHRDVKPTNIMIERTDDGALKPYVMDFGLARRVDSRTITANEAVGTPQYMAPEQARGASVDVRTDVYGLGATLYAALVDRPPFVGVTAPEVLLAVLRDEPTRLRKIVPSLPRDLETITMKCLEKDPARRYPTARALADDLGRFLDGDPIEAVPPKLGYRLLKRARKHRAAVTAGALALAGIATTGAAALHARHTAQERARLAQVFGQTVQSIEAIVRYAQLLPLHDTRRETGEARALLDGIEAQKHELGAVAEGPAAYAIGRAHLALGEAEAARRELERAWAAGWRTPDVAGALGLALGELYEQALDAAERIDSGELRKRAVADAERELRDPALARLQAGASAQTLPPAFVEGVLAFHQRQLDRAIASARRAAEEVPWLYEARRLEGDAQSQRGSSLRDHGDYDGALAAFDAAEAAYRRAEEIARSDAASYLAECQLGFRRMHTLTMRSVSPASAFERMRPACEAARTANPSGSDAAAMIARGWAELADYQQAHDQDPLPAVEQAISVGKQVLEKDPTNELALGAIGYAYDSKAAVENERGLDARPSIVAAVASFQRAVAVHPTAYNLNMLAAMQVRQAEYELDHGLDPSSTVKAAEARLDQAIERTPDLYTLQANYGLLEKTRARWEVDQGIDPTASTEREIDHLRRSLALNPSFARLHRELGMAFAMRAEHAVAHGADARPALDQASREEEASLALEKNPIALENLASIARLRALDALSRGDDARPALELGREKLAELRQLDAHADSYEDELIRCELELVAARAAQARKQSGADELARAIAAGERALEKNPREQRTLLALAEAKRLDGEAKGAAGAKQRSEAAALVARALELNPSSVRARALRGQLASASKR